MGRDKALLPVPGNERVTFMEHLVTLLGAFCEEVVLVVRDDVVAATCPLAGVHIVVDARPDVGPLMGVYSGLSAIQAHCALVVAVDMPCVQPALISLLFEQSREELFCVPVVDGVPQVLLAVYPRTLLPLIERCLQRGRRDPRALLEIAPVQYVSEAQLRQVDPQLRSFLNMNTPEDLARLR